MTCQHLYVSRCAAGLTAQDLRFILGTSQMLNRRSDVTGILVWTGSYFAQVLEGLPETIAPLVAKILKDPRHVDGRVLVTRSGLTRRTFGDWSMDLFEGPALEENVSRIYQALPDELEARSADLLDAIDALVRDTRGSSTTVRPDQFQFRVSAS